MKVVLENELEKCAWEMMMKFHKLWHENDGKGFRERIDWYFNDYCKEEMIAKEVWFRLVQDNGPELLEVVEVTEEQYVQKGLDCYSKEYGLSNEEEMQRVKDVLVEEYRRFIKHYNVDKKLKEDEVREELAKLYYTFFSAPEKLIVYYKDKIIQGDNNVIKEG